MIVRFINRKNAFSCLRKIAKSIPYKNIYITENLCPANKKMFNSLYKLKKEGSISGVWTFNGSVFFRKSDSEEEYGQKVEHIDDVDFYLSDNSEMDE